MRLTVTRVPFRLMIAKVGHKGIKTVEYKHDKLDIFNGQLKLEEKGYWWSRCKEGRYYSRIHVYNSNIFNPLSPNFVAESIEPCKVEIVLKDVTFGPWGTQSDFTWTVSAPARLFTIYLGRMLKVNNA